MRARNFLLLSLVPATLLAAKPLAEILMLQPDSEVWVTGTSSVRDYKCTAKTIASKIEAPARPATLRLDELVRSAQVEVSLAELDCGNGTMNGHMRKALKTEQFPKLSYVLTSYTINGTDIQLQGKLTIAGSERPVEMKGTVTEENGAVHASATQQIRMTEWGVKPPSLMLGTMKVHEPVTIGFDIALQR